MASCAAVSARPAHSMRSCRPLRVTQALALPALLVALACGGTRAPARPASAARAGDTPAPRAPGTAPPGARPGGSAAPAGGDATRDEPRSDDADDADASPDDSFDEERTDATLAPLHPLASVGEAELERRLASDPRSLGPMSIGRPSSGLLFNGSSMPEGDGYRLMDPSHAFATEETLHDVGVAIAAVLRAHPGTPRLALGDFSAKEGGPIHPHVSHQSGRDVDVGYYYLEGERWYRRAGPENLDLGRTWALVRAMITDTDVELVLIDTSIQKLLREHAEKIGEDGAWLESLFKGRAGLPPIIRHAPGHATHLHARFYNPVAEETGRRVYPLLVKHHLVHAAPPFVIHVAKKGETLASLSKRYGTSVRAIRRANGLRTTLIQARKAYKIPAGTHAAPVVAQSRVVLPPRRLPPARPAP